MDYYNRNFENPEGIRREYPYLDLQSGKLRGKPSFDGQRGGFPLMFDAEEDLLTVDGGDSHTLVFGASGSKKTRTMVMPSIHILAEAQESMVIHDAKGELYERTAGMLKQRGYRLVCINLRDPAVGDCWNPLAIPYAYYKAGDMDRAAEYANDIANTLLRSEKINGDVFWVDSACDCCYGLILLLMRYCREYDVPDSAVNMANLAQLRRVLFDQSGRKEPQNSWLWKWGSQDELIASGLTGTVTTAPETMKGILSTLDSKLRTFTIQPTLLDMLANNSIDIESIGMEKTAVFLITPDEKSAGYRSLVALFVSQSYQYLIYSAGKTGGKVLKRINYILDEFSSLPAIGQDSFPSMITAGRSRNIRFLIVAQSKHQLKSKYGDDADTIMANCSNWVIMFTRELELLREVSELCGKQSNDKPNISVFELQHFSKEKHEVLLMAGRLKPAVVRLMDISRLDKNSFQKIPIGTPLRMERVRLDFAGNRRKLLDELLAKKGEETSVAPAADQTEKNHAGTAPEQKRQASGDAAPKKDAFLDTIGLQLNDVLKQIRQTDEEENG